MSQRIITAPALVLFSGLPGTLKTFLSSRIAQRLGCVCLPTIGFGHPASHQKGETLHHARAERYTHCQSAIQLLSNMSAKVVVDGGFMEDSQRYALFSIWKTGPKILLICQASAATRRARLKQRANDPDDPEQNSALILSNQMDTTPEVECVYSHSGADIVCLIDTDTSQTDWRILSEDGKTLIEVREAIEHALSVAFAEFRATDKWSGKKGIQHNFSELANDYDDSTVWRTDANLLAAMQVTLPDASTVVDIGCGTGLASAWYQEQGHRCIGIDLSPKMTVRAAPRLLVTNFGSALDLPLFDQQADLVLMRQILHYTEPLLALQEARRVLKPGGRLVLSSIVMPNMEQRALWEEFKNLTQPLRLRVFAEQELPEMLEQTGFRICENRHACLPRDEAVSRIALRAPEPAGGWLSCLQMLEKLFSAVTPQLEFACDGNILRYRQHWLTVVAEVA